MNARESIPSWFLVSSVLLATALTGCARPTPNAPASDRASAHANQSFLAAGPDAGGAYFPLQIGNRWHSESTERRRPRMVQPLRATRISISPRIGSHGRGRESDRHGVRGL